MKKPSVYVIAGYIGLSFVVLFYVYDYFYLNLSPIIRYGIGVSIIFVFVISTIILKARRDESFRVSTAKRFGDVIFHDDKSLSFVRNTTTFNWESALGGHKISFCLPSNQEIFSLRHQSWKPVPDNVPLIAQMLNGGNRDDSFEKLLLDCKIVKVSEVSGEFVLLSKNPEFLQLLLNNQNVKDNLNKYIGNKIGITFDGNLFEMNWQTGSNEELEDFRQICQTAIIFRDEITALLKR